MRKIKPDFSIKQIGKIRFYVGTVVGFGTGFFLYFLFLNFHRITFEFAPVVSGINNIYPIKDISFPNAFLLALLANSLGFCFTAYIWMSNVFHSNFRIKRLMRITQTNSIFIIGLMAYMLFRYFTVIMTFDLAQIDFNLVDNFGIAIFMLPVFIFLYNWLYIVKAFKSKRALLTSLGVLIIYGLILSGIRT